MTFVLLSPDGTLRQVVSLDGEDVSEKQVFETEAFGKPECELFDPASGKWVQDIDKLKVSAIARIDAEREARQQAFLTPGSVKTLMYAQKAGEVARYNRMGVAAVTDMSDAARRIQFPAVCAEVDVTGDEFSTVIDRIAAALPEAVYVIDAMATLAKRAVREADDDASILLACEIDWPDQG